MKASLGEKTFNVVNVFILALITFATLYPFWYVLVISLNNNAVASYLDVYFWPKAFTLANYKVIFSTSLLVSGYKITILRTVIGTVISVIGNAAMAYVLVKKQLMGRKVLISLVLITLYFSGGIIPLYILLRNLHLINTFPVLIIPYLFTAWYIILMKTYFSQLPESLDESARIDGANDIVIFFRIIMPISMPIISTISLFCAVGYWNDWFAGDMYLSDQNLFPIQTILMKILNEMKGDEILRRSSSGVVDSNHMPSLEAVKNASIIVTIIPIILVYPFLQKYFIKGIMIGSIKG